MFRKILVSLIVIIILGVSICSCVKHIDEATSDTNLDSNTEAVPQSTSKWVNTPIFKDFLIMDSDGDGVDDHVVEHNMVAMSGGHGGYELFVYERSDSWGYEEVFNSNEYLEQHPNMDIQITEMSNGRIIFQQQPTGYEVEFFVDDEANPYLFNEDGTPMENPNFVVDTFKTIEAVDIDNDGSDELVMRQYCSIGWHANYIGDLESVWKLIDGKLVLISLKLYTK